MIKAIVTDIEGTTTSISFVTESLFPFARARIRAFIHDNANDQEVATEIAAVRQLIGNPDADLATVASALEEWIDTDQKITPLKTLQGLIWKAGYLTGELKGHLYQDVLPVLETWHNSGIALFVYSSGSVAAQKLLFGFSECGDLTPLFSGYFDTHVGNKRESQSYDAIVKSLGYQPDEVLFLSDIVQELDAAAAAGLHTLGLDRACIGDGFGAHPFVHNFSQIALPNDDRQS